LPVSIGGVRWTTVTNTSVPWVPLSQRGSGQPTVQALVEGVPDWLHRHLVIWMYRNLQSWQGPVLALRHDSDLKDEARQVMVRIRTSLQPWTMSADDPQFLDAVDATLHCASWLPDYDDDPGIELERLLVAAGSAWRVSDRFRGLERRVDRTVSRAVEEATAVPIAGDHLAIAWEAAYGRNPDPDKAYDEAVLAVEALACPLVCLNSTVPTLGTVIRDLRAQAAKWELAVGDTRTNGAATVGPMLAMLEMLWYGQSRHAGSANSRRQTQVEGESAVHLAATLVQWLGNGVLRRK
jgi:hypothetical protein